MKRPVPKPSARRILSVIAAALCAAVFLSAAPARAASGQADLVTTESGVLQGTTGRSPGVRVFKGIPYARPPVGDLRWRPPRPPARWTGVRAADTFGPRAMQLPLFSDMVFRSDGMSEDCLHLNVWTPARSGRERLPVLVYFFGGGFVAGDGSEPRYDGESMARRGVVAVTVTFRLGVFGFLAHPGLAQESPLGASGNYGLMDQGAALRWVRDNIGAFGGDPKRVTVGGESAGSYSVSAVMASPWSRNLIAGAIGESGSLMGTRPVPALADAERSGVEFAARLGVSDAGASGVAALRALPAATILAATAGPDAPRLGADVDGDFLPRPPAEIYGAGLQAHVPLLVGWNSQESDAGGVLGRDTPTPENFAAAVRRLYGERAPDVLAAYPASTDAQARQAATDLASDRFIAFSTWKWYDLQRRTGGSPVYRYFFSRPRPGGAGAVHSGEIEYALGNLGTNTVYAWTPDDFTTSQTMQGYFANFVKSGDPNGPGLPAWPSSGAGSPETVMRLDVASHAAPDVTRARYEVLDRLYAQSASGAALAR